MRAAFYEKEITPPIGSDIPGYYKNRYTVGVKDKLYAKAAVFEDGSGNIAALLVLDAVCVTRAFCEAIKTRAEAFTGIPTKKIAVIANHTHYGIPGGDLRSERDEEFMSLMERLCADTITLAWQRLEPCTLAYGIGQESTTPFNRDYILQDGAIVTNPGKFRDQILRPYGDIDPDLPVLTVKNTQDGVMGAIFTFALHEDTTGGLEYSGDYASEISYALKERYGQQAVSVYLPGYSGDINHVDQLGGIRRTHREIGRIIAGELLRVMEEASVPVEGKALRMEYRELPMERRRATSEQIAYARWVAEDRKARKDKYDMTGQNAPLLLEYEEAVRDGGNRVEVIIQILKLGDVWIFITPFEVYHKYGNDIKAGIPGEKWLISELANMESSYIPVPELFDTAAYPAQLCYGSWMEVSAGQKLVEGVLRLAEEMK